MIYYGSVYRESTLKLNIERINKLQKRMTRIILKDDLITPSEGMLKG